jgi:hypothetical protein
MRVAGLADLTGTTVRTSVVAWGCRKEWHGVRAGTPAGAAAGLGLDPTSAQRVRHTFADSMPAAENL